MKVIKTENNQEKIYVQMQDMGHLNSTDMPIPASIYMKVFGNGVTIIDDSNRFSFVSFEDPKDIEFFKGLDFIIDYNEYKHLGLEEISKKGEEVSTAIHGIVTKYNAMSDDEKKKNANMIDAYNNLEYKIAAIAELYHIKQSGLDLEPFFDPKGNAKRKRR